MYYTTATAQFPWHPADRCTSPLFFLFLFLFGGLGSSSHEFFSNVASPQNLFSTLIAVLFFRSDSPLP